MSVGKKDEPKDASSLDVRVLVEWLGAAGAKAGLAQSKNCTNETLIEIAKSLGLSPAKSTSRGQLVDDIIRVASRRIDKPIEDLYRMSKEDLVAYFTRIKATSEELLDILRALELNPTKEGHKSLIELAARELSETGRFQRIASSGRSTEKKEEH